MARRGREGLDPYERALIAGAQAAQPAAEGEDDDAPPPLPRKAGIGNLKVGSLGLLAFLAAIVLVAVIRAGAEERAALVEPDCARPQLALAPVEVQQHRPVTYTFTGPEADYLVTVDALSADPAAEGVAGRPVQRVREWSPVRGCLLTTKFGAQVEPGRHVLQVWRAPGAVCAQDAAGEACVAAAELVAYAPFVVVPER